MVWPNVSKVHEYRKEVYTVITDAIAHHPSLEDAAGRGVAVHQEHPM